MEPILKSLRSGRKPQDHQPAAGYGANHQRYSKAWYRRLVRLGCVSQHAIYLPAIGPDPVIVDLGGNKGSFSREMAALYEVRGFIVEAAPALFASLAPPKGMTKVHAAVTDRDGVAQFNLSSEDDAHSLYTPFGGAVIDQCEVRAMCPETLWAEHGIEHIDLLKVDIEGAEIAVLSAMTDSMLQAIHQITIEFHSAFGAYAEVAVDRVIERLRDLGFAFYDFYQPRYTNSLFIHREGCRLSRMEARYLSSISRRLMWRLGPQ